MANHNALDVNDSGHRSRKLWYAIGTSLGIFGGGLLAAIWPAFRASYETMIGGLVAVLGLYLTGNVSNKFVVGKNIAKSTSAVTTGRKPKKNPPIEPLPD